MHFLLVQITYVYLSTCTTNVVFGSLHVLVMHFVLFTPTHTGITLCGHILPTLVIQKYHFIREVKPGMTWKELDAKLREGCEQDREQRQRANAHKALAKALGAALPEEFEVAESGRLAQLLAKRRSNGQMQISAELVPIPDASRMRPGCVRMRRDASGF